MAGKPPRGRKNHQPMPWSCCRMCRCHQCPNGLWVCSVAKLLNHSPTVQAYCHKLRGLALFPSYIHQCQSTWCVLLTAPAQPPGTAGSSHCPGTATTPPPPTAQPLPTALQLVQSGCHSLAAESMAENELHAPPSSSCNLKTLNTVFTEEPAVISTWVF